MKIGVLGAGAIGCFVGGRLAAGGRDVVFLGRERLKREIDRHGLTLEDLDHPTMRADKPKFELDPLALADCDVILCCVKSGATTEAARSLTLRKDAVVVSLQNGLRNAEMLRDVLAQTVLAGIVGFNVVSKGEGVYRQATTGQLVIETGGGAAADELTRALARVGFDVKREPKMRELQWAKLLYNLNNAISALSDRPTREIVLDAGYRSILAAVMAEALSVLAAAGIEPARLGPLPPGVLPRLLGLPTWLVRILARTQLKIDPEARSSMWEDLSNNRPTEIDWLNGEVVRLAKASNVDAPLNARIVAIVHDAEEAKNGSPKLTADQLWRALRT